MQLEITTNSTIFQTKPAAQAGFWFVENPSIEAQFCAVDDS
jgi:hypothetical protein